MERGADGQPATVGAMEPRRREQGEPADLHQLRRGGAMAERQTAGQKGESKGCRAP